MAKTGIKLCTNKWRSRGGPALKMIKEITEVMKHRTVREIGNDHGQNAGWQRDGRITSVILVT